MENMGAKSLTDARRGEILGGVRGANFLARILQTVTTIGGIQSMRNHGLKVLGLALLSALGMMAFTAAGAQAQLPGESTAGTFLVNLGTPSSNAVTGEQNGAGYLLVAARDLKIECQSGTLNNAKINNSTDGQAEVTFEECVANNHKGEVLEGCEFKTLKTITASALALPILHGGEEFVLFEPLSGTQFANVTFKAAQGCILPLNNPVTGSVVAEVVGEELEANVQTLAFSEAIQLLSGDVLKYGALSNTSYVNGTADVSVTGVNTKLGVH